MTKFFWFVLLVGSMGMQNSEPRDPPPSRADQTPVSASAPNPQTEGEKVRPVTDADQNEGEPSEQQETPASPDPANAVSGSSQEKGSDPDAAVDQAREEGTGTVVPMTDAAAAGVATLTPHLALQTQITNLATATPIVEYHIEVQLDSKQKMLYGRQRLIYTNHSPDIIPDLMFHLYLNAFRNSRSTYMMELDESNGGEAEAWGYIHIEKAEVGGVDRTGAITFEPSPEGAPGDKSVMRLPLTEPLFPGSSVEVNFQFKAKLPEVFDRSGYKHDFFMVAQWFPKVGVWQTEGFRYAERPGWNCHDFHANTEFFANFGNYHVEINLPAKYVVGATGVLLETRVLDDRKIHVFEQTGVHDFAFTASPRFIREVRTFQPGEWLPESEIEAVMKRHRLTRDEVALPPVDMILLIQPDHRGQIDRHFEALAQAIKYFGLWYGPYPYKTITMVDPGYNARAAGGMEYPNLITLGTLWLLPEDDLTLEDLIIHEFGHQYWYGMVASNEFEEAWLDEGINSYSTNQILDRVYGDAWDYETVFKTRLSLERMIGIKGLPHWVRERKRMLGEREVDQVVKNGWEYPSSSSYAINSYAKPATLLNQLRIELSDDVMAQVMRTFFQRWQFKHPATRDFVDVVNEVSGEDMTWFFEELFYQPGTLDYAVAVESREVINEGFMDSEAGPVLLPESARDTSGTSFKHVVTISNGGNIHYPVDLRVEFRDGAVETRHWRGDAPRKRFEFIHNADILKAIVDPDSRIIIDNNRANNSYIAKGDGHRARRWSLRLLVVTQQLLQWLGGGL